MNRAAFAADKEEHQRRIIMGMTCRKIGKIAAVVLLLFTVLISSAFAQSSNRTRADKFMKQAQDAFNSAQYDDAILYAKMAAQSDPDYEVPHIFLADTYLLKDMKPDAVSEYEKAVSLSPNNADYLIKLGQTEFRVQNYDKAVSTLKKAEGINPNNPLIYYYFSEIYRATEQKDLAIENMNKMLALMDSDKSWESNKEMTTRYWETHRYLGALYIEKKNWELAYPHFKKIAEECNDELIKRSTDMEYKTVTQQMNSKKVGYGLIIASIVIVILLLLFYKFYILPQTKAANAVKPSKTATDIKNFQTLATYSVERFKALTQMPQALVYFAVNDKDPLMLIMAENLERDKYENLSVKWTDLPNWVSSNQGKPFAYEAEKKEVEFIRAFPNWREKLDPAAPRIAIPLIYQNAFRGIIFMCFAQMKDRGKYRKLFKQNYEEITKIAEEIATAADRIYVRETSRSDSITSAYNQLYFKERLPEEISLAKKKNWGATLLFVECDGVGAILKRFGEERKNYTLKTVLQEMRAKLDPAEASFFRVSDFRFAVIIQNCDVARGKEIATEIGNIISNLKFTSPIPSITVSIGMANYPQHTSDAKMLEQATRAALDMAVNTGRNKLVVESEYDFIHAPTFKSPPLPNLPPGTGSKAEILDKEQEKKSGRATSEINIETNSEQAQEEYSSADERVEELEDTVSIRPSAPGSTELARSAEQKDDEELKIKASVIYIPPPGKEKKLTDDLKGELKPTPLTRISEDVKPEFTSENQGAGTGGYRVGTVPTGSSILRKYREERAGSGVFNVKADPGKTDNSAPLSNETDGQKGEKSASKIPGAGLFRKVSSRPVEENDNENSVAAGSGISPDPLPDIEDSPGKMSEPSAPVTRRGQLRSSLKQAEGADTTALDVPGSLAGSGAGGQHPAMFGPIRRTKSPSQAFKKRALENTRSPFIESSSDIPLIPLDDEEAPKDFGKTDLTRRPGELPKPKFAPVEPDFSKQAHPPAKPPARSGSPSSGFISKPDIKPMKPESGQLRQAKTPAADENSAMAAPMRTRQAPQVAKDPVTDFYFKTYFEQSIVRLLARASQTRTPLGILFFKLDKHKELKGKYGQENLNVVLKEIAKITQEFLKDTDIPARYSDEIFVLLLPDTSFQIAFNLAEQIRFTVANMRFPEIPIVITMSLGISSFPEKGKTTQEVMKNSYDALAQAIRTGGNKSVIWDDKAKK